MHGSASSLLFFIFIILHTFACFCRTLHCIAGGSDWHHSPLPVSGGGGGSQIAPPPPPSPPRCIPGGTPYWSRQRCCGLVPVRGCHGVRQSVACAGTLSARTTASCAESESRVQRNRTARNCVFPAANVSTNSLFSFCCSASDLTEIGSPPPRKRERTASNGGGGTLGFHTRHPPPPSRGRSRISE